MEGTIPKELATLTVLATLKLGEFDLFRGCNLQFRFLPFLLSALHSIANTPAKAAENDLEGRIPSELEALLTTLQSCELGEPYLTIVRTL